MEDIYNKWQLIDLDLKKIEPVIFTKEELKNEYKQLKKMYKRIKNNVI